MLGKGDAAEFGLRRRKAPERARRLKAKEGMRVRPGLIRVDKDHLPPDRRKIEGEVRGDEAFADPALRA